MNLTVGQIETKKDIGKKYNVKLINKLNDEQYCKKIDGGKLFEHSKFVCTLLLVAILVGTKYDVKNIERNKIDKDEYDNFFNNIADNIWYDENMCPFEQLDQTKLDKYKAETFIEICAKFRVGSMV
jgi:hypothetical protein